MVFQILLVKSRLFRMVLPHDTKCVTSVIALYGFAPCVHGRCACIGGNRRCDFFGAYVSGNLSCRQYTCLVIPFFWLRFVNKVQRVAHALNMARLQQVYINHGYTTTYNGIITEFYGYLLSLQCLYRLLSVYLMTVHASVTSCPCILRLVVHHVRHSVQDFTLDAFRFLTFGTQLFFFCLSQCGCFIGNTSAFIIRFHFSAFGGTGYLLPNEQFLFGCINRRFAFFLGSNLFGNGVATFRFGFLQLLQGFFLVGNHSIGYGLCHILITLSLLHNGIPSCVAVGLLI